MAIINEISRIQTAASSIKNKLSELGITVASPSRIDDCANAISNIEPRTVSTSKLTAVTTAVTISQGYYAESATISVDTSTITSVSLSTSEQTLSCANKMMTSNITIPSVNVYISGSSTPDGSIGNDGDIYLVTN